MKINKEIIKEMTKEEKIKSKFIIRDKLSKLRQYDIMNNKKISINEKIKLLNSIFINNGLFYKVYNYLLEINES